MWLKRRKGSAMIYTLNGNNHAVVDRRGFGIKAALGHNITYRDQSFKSVSEAKEYVEQLNEQK